MFHERLRALREKRGMTQEQLAQMLEVSVDCVRDWEKPHDRRPSITQVLALAQHLQVTVDDMLGFADKGRRAGMLARGTVSTAAAADNARPAGSECTAPPSALPVSLLQKLCTLRPGELEQVEAYIAQLIAQRDDFYIY